MIGRLLDARVGSSIGLAAHIAAADVAFAGAVDLAEATAASRQVAALEDGTDRHADNGEHKGDEGDCDGLDHQGYRPFSLSTEIVEQDVLSLNAEIEQHVDN